MLQCCGRAKNQLRTKINVQLLVDEYVQMLTEDLLCVAGL